MKNAKFYILLLLAFSWLLVGCGEAELPTLIEANSPEMGITLSYPETWVNRWEPFNMQMATDEQFLGDPINITDGSMIIVTGVDTNRIGGLGNDLNSSSSAIEFLQFFEEMVIQGAPGSVVRQAPEYVQYNGRTAATMVVDLQNKEGDPVYALLTAVPNENIVVFIFLGTNAEQETEMQPLFDVILDSIELDTPGLQQW